LNNHVARITWAGGAFAYGPEAVIDEMTIALVRSGVGTDGIADSYVNGNYISSNTGGILSRFSNGLEIGAWTANGNYGHHDIAIIWAWNRKLTDAEVALAFAMAAERVGTEVDPPPLGTLPDPPTNAVQTGSTVDSVTFDVTLPAVAPDFIRVAIGSALRTFDVAVTVAGGADQSITITGLVAGREYAFGFYSVADGLRSTTSFRAEGTTADAGSDTLDTPTSPSAEYAVGPSTLYVTVTPGANNPAGTSFYLECGLVTTGPYTHGGMSVWGGTGNVTISAAFPQTAGTETLFYTVHASKSGWTDSADISEGSVAVPAQ
jgi:hypothetical protein